MKLERLGGQCQALFSDGHRESVVAFFHRRLHHVHGRTADETADEEIDGVVVELLGRRHLLQLALAHHRHTVTHGHGLDLVVSDVDRGHAELVLQAADLGTHLHAELGVQIGAVSYTHLRAHETRHDLVCRLLLEKKKKKKKK